MILLKKLLGWSLLASPFVLLLYVYFAAYGVTVTLALLGGTLLFLGGIALGVYLIAE